MGILGITNRTENWKTAKSFAPFFKNECARVALAHRLCEPADTPHKEIRIELFWKGMRDYIHSQGEGTKPTHQALADCYNRLFPDLRGQIEKFPGFRLKWQPSHYNASKQNHDGLFNNLRNTEIDIVLETPTRLFIGEAKDESTLGADGKSVLVHQLIRQYVMTTILVELVPLPPDGVKKEVIPFVVGDVESYQQVKFMIEQRKHDRGPRGWLKEENILSWNCIKRIAESTAADS